MVMKALRQLTFLQLFGYLAMLLGILIEAYALIVHPGTLLSGDDMFGGAIVLALAVTFLHDSFLPLKLVLIGLCALGLGYFIFIHTQSWIWTSLLTLATAAFLIYFFGIRKSIRQSHSDWTHY